MLNYKLVSMTAEHLEQVARLEQSCFSHPRSRAMLAVQLDNLSAALFVAQGEVGIVLGYAGLNVVLDEGYINNVAVDARYRKCGVASALLGVFLRFAAAQRLAFLTLEERVGN